MANKTNDVLAAILTKMQEQDARIATLMTTKAPAKAAPTKSEPAKAAAPELAISLADGKYGTGLVLSFHGRRSGRFLYPAELEILFKHKAGVEAAIKKIGSK